MDSSNVISWISPFVILGVSALKAELQTTDLHIKVTLWREKPDRVAQSVERLTQEPEVPGSIPGPEVIKLFPCSTQLSMKFFLLINVKMPTIVGILTFMGRKNGIISLSEPKKCRISRYFYTYEHEHEKSFITSGPGPAVPFVSPSADSRRAVVSHWRRKYMHLVLVLKPPRRSKPAQE